MSKSDKSRSAKSWPSERRLDRIWSNTFGSYEYFLLKEKTWSKFSHGAIVGRNEGDNVLDICNQLHFKLRGGVITVW